MIRLFFIVRATGSSAGFDPTALIMPKERIRRFDALVTCTRTLCHLNFLAAQISITSESKFSLIQKGLKSPNLDRSVTVDKVDLILVA